MEIQVIRIIQEALSNVRKHARARSATVELRVADDCVEITMDIHMPGMNGLDVTRLIYRDVPETRIVVLTVSEQDNHLFESIKLGAQGYLLKNVTAEILREMLTAVSRGEAPISPLMASKTLSEFVQRVPFVTLPRPEEELTPREKEVLTLVAAGVENGMIAERLCLAPGTVKRHMHNILAKLHARNRAEAAACALHYGLISAASETQS